jgi:hypothetical protein
MKCEPGILPDDPFGEEVVCTKPARHRLYFPGGEERDLCDEHLNFWTDYYHRGEEHLVELTEDFIIAEMEEKFMGKRRFTGLDAALKKRYDKASEKWAKELTEKIIPQLFLK